jgi:hypothetical protein
MTVDEMLTRISSLELSEWRVYAQLYGLRRERADLRSGIIAATLANIHRKKGGKRFAPSDFMPKDRAESTPARATADVTPGSQSFANYLRMFKRRDGH